jgi:hypothetical protein
MENGGTTASADLLDDVIASLAISAVHHHVCSGRAEPECNDASDAIGRPGDEEGFAGRIHGRQCFGSASIPGSSGY